MTPVVFVLAASLGAMLRLTVGLVERTWQALLLVNLAGAFVLGWVVHADLSPAAVTIIGAGFCGALTTYSSFALEARSLGAARGTAYCALTVAGVLGAAALGSFLA